MQEEQLTYKIGVHPPKIQPKISSIGYGNPRYNSMVVYKSGILISSGSHLRLTNIEKGKILFDKQIGCCQIFQIQENQRYILTVNYDGFITLLDKTSLETIHQFYAPGKQIRHSSFTEKYFACSCELLNDNQEGLLVVYKLEDIEKGNYEPFHSIKGRFYFPQYCDDQLTVLQYHDPNPKGRKRKETVMSQKLPIINQILKFDIDFKIKYQYKIQQEGEMICCTQNKGIVYYLHTTKRMTVMDIKKEQIFQFQIPSKSFPHLVQNYENGVVYSSQANKLNHVIFNFQTKKHTIEVKEIKSLAIGGNMSLKFANKGIYSLNQSGLHFYNYQSKKTITQSLFNITNCGITFNQKGDLFAVADFGGSFFIFNSSDDGGNPDPLFTIFTGIPIRSIAWCPHSNNLVIGCIGGSLFWWKFGHPEAQMVQQFDHTVNIIRAVKQKIFVGSSDGKVMIYDSKTMKSLGQYKAHHPINYQTEQERELFGSMKNYAQIWSLTIPHNKQELFIVSSCEDQTQKVYKANLHTQQFEMINHLKGHDLAVTSIDWKLMNQHLGQIYVSCSDDKIIRFRDPNQHFMVLFEVETSTIKEWHTLTYLALEPNGYRVAIGSQNGYVFIFDIHKRELLFGEKVHLGGIQGLDWVGNKICTCSSDLCINIFTL